MKKNNVVRNPMFVSICRARSRARRPRSSLSCSLAIWCTLSPRLVSHNKDIACASSVRPHSTETRFHGCLIFFPYVRVCPEVHSRVVTCTAGLKGHLHPDATFKRHIFLKVLKEKKEHTSHYSSLFGHNKEDGCIEF